MDRLIVPKDMLLKSKGFGWLGLIVERWGNIVTLCVCVCL